MDVKTKKLLSQLTFSELADIAAEAKGHMSDLLVAFPMEIEGYSDLEHAVELLGKVEHNLDEAAEDPDRFL